MASHSIGIRNNAGDFSAEWLAFVDANYSTTRQGYTVVRPDLPLKMVGNCNKILAKYNATIVSNYISFETSEDALMFKLKFI